MNRQLIRSCVFLHLCLLPLIAVGAQTAATKKPPAPAKSSAPATKPSVPEHPVSLPENTPPSTCLECHSVESGKYVHTAMSMGCTTCHNIQTAKGVTHITLVAPPDKLCETCHALSTDKVLHGPYKEGLCVVCHSPHSSDFPNHTLASAQDICLGCHARARLKYDEKEKSAMTTWGWKFYFTNQKTDKVTTPWDKTLTFPEMKGWMFLNLNATLTANHPVSGHPISGPNINPALPPVSCQSCHKDHASNYQNLLTAGPLKSLPDCATCGVCKQCHTDMF